MSLLYIFSMVLSVVNALLLKRLRIEAPDVALGDSGLLLILVEIKILKCFGVCLVMFFYCGKHPSLTDFRWN